MNIPDKIELVAIGDLVPYAQNARTHSDEQIKMIAASMVEFGWSNPVIINGSGGIIAGHGRVLAAKLNGMEQVPCVRLAHLSAEKERALIIADNKLALNAGWDEEILLAEINDLIAQGVDVALTGFDQGEIDALISDAQGAVARNQAPKGNLADEFLIPPFTVMNAREGWWMDRKRAWLALGIKSEVGRGENLLGMSDTMLEPDPKKAAEACGMVDMTAIEWPEAQDD